MVEYEKTRDNKTLWNLQEDSKKERVTVHCYESPRGKNTFKASGVVDFPASVCFQVMSAAAWRTKYDINIAESRMIQPLATNTYAIYQKSKEMGIWPAKIESRDFVMCNHVEKVSTLEKLIFYF